MKMDDLVAFLRARLDEDEADALAWPVDEHRWRVVGKRHLTYGNGSGEHAVAIDVSGRPLDWWERIWVRRDIDGLSQHIARHDPARVLHAVEAKRRMVSRILYHADIVGRDEIHGDLLRSMAQEYADHPEFRSDWKV